MVLPCVVGNGNVRLDDEHAVFAYGDSTLRYETDWGSQVGRNDMARLRITQHLGLKWLPEEWLELNVRARTGTIENQHTPTVSIINFYGERTADRDVFADRYFLRYNGTGSTVTLGRQEYPFWFVTDYAWDTDIDPTGLSGSYSADVGGGRAAVRAGWFRLPDGSLRLHGQQWAAQADYSHATGEHSGMRYALGAFRYLGEPDPRYLRQGDGERDYFLLVGSVRRSFVLMGRPGWVGIDVIENIQDYERNGADPVVEQYAGETSGYGFGLSWGENREQGDLRLRYNYAHLEKLAVNRSYAQDTLSQVDKSNISGHDIRVIYSLAADLTVMARLSITEELEGVEAGKRFRIDLNWEF